ncbi:MAG: Verru_Chthon cassette protein A [Verrucomicrobiae bacterium]|nr:Verru_Chthon cassette protein A [Verrucomicrobiae bacterium]
MKTHSKPITPGKSTPQRRRGVALLTVLTIVSLCTILVLTFFQLAQNEMVASNSYNNGLEAQQVAEQAVNLVIRQIRMATSSNEKAWASQPGAIRVWDDNGKFEAGYKLYSDDNMVVTSEAQLVTQDYPELALWDTKPWKFVDLNEPVVRGDKVYYPIVDPTARVIPKWNKPLGDDTEGIEGFFTYPEDGDKNSLKFLANQEMDLGPMQSALREVDPSDRIPRKPLPMPATWIYQLKDGTIGFLDDNKRFQASDGGGGGATVQNPIVARVAFWADDETTKLNPNVHAGGAAWGTPLAGGDIDRGLGKFQPAQHEWQRYPGHPATTHLAPVIAPGIPDITYSADTMELIFDLVPRVVGGGSMSGTIKVNTKDEAEMNGLIPDKDRLYASLDEFLLEPGPKGQRDDFREPNIFPDPNNRFGQSKNAKEMQEHLERSKFFLSVVSKAPETTLFNTPRISIWPTHWDKAPNHSSRHFTAFDKLIRFCAEIGGDQANRYQYHFQRFNADSTTEDYTEIKRNRELMDYLDDLTSRKIPGFGKSFAGKYSTETRRQILTEIFDYIRSTDLHDDTLYVDNWREAFTPPKENSRDVYTYTNGRMNDNGERRTHKGHGQVTPIEIDFKGTPTKGFGRFYTLSEMGVVIICCADAGPGVQFFKDHPDEQIFPDDPRSNLSRDYNQKLAMSVDPEEIRRLRMDLMLGGEGMLANPGTSVYGGGKVEEVGSIPSAGNTLWNEKVLTSREYAQIEKYQASNIPPLPTISLDLIRQSYRHPETSSLPAWLMEFRDVADFWDIDKKPLPDFTELGLAFFENKLLDKDNWNYQLAWLDSGANPSNKFSFEGNPAITRLQPGQQLLQAALVWNMFCPSVGWVPINVDMMLDIAINGMRFQSATGPVEIGAGASLPSSLSNQPSEYAWASNRQEVTWHDRHYGGMKPFTYFMTANSDVGGTRVTGSNIYSEYWPEQTNPSYPPGIGRNGRVSPVDYNFENGPQGKKQFNRYFWVTKPFVVNNYSVFMNNGTVDMNIYASGWNNREEAHSDGTGVEWSASQASDAQLVQSISVPFDSFTVKAPKLASGRETYINDVGGQAPGKTGPMEYWSLTNDGANPNVASRGRMAKINGHQGGLFSAGDVVKSVGIRHGDVRVAATRRVIAANDGLYAKHVRYDDPNERMAHEFMTTPGWGFPGTDLSDRSRWLVDSPDSRFKYHSQRTPTLMYSDRSREVQLFGDFDSGMGNSIDGPYINKPDEGNIHSLFNRTDPTATGLGLWDLMRDYGDFPYFVRDYIHESGTPAYFSPNRIIASPVQFGSLSVGSNEAWNGMSGRPWTTLLFRPDVDGGIYTSHPGSSRGGAVIPDHLLLDLFWMPVVEPYAISEPLATSGKVNLNYQILPYHHIKRNTAIRGVFKSEYMLCVPNSHTNDYKVGFGRGIGYHWRDHPFDGSLQKKSLRTLILEDKTLYQFEKRFSQNEIFKSASEICDIYLIPQEVSKRMGFGGSGGSIQTTDFTNKTPEQAVQAMKDGSYWSDHAAVGDNGKERPYSDIYGRITTKSNAYKVHYRAQILRKAKGTTPDVWNSDVDQVVAEYRGSSVVERYVEPGDPDIPDYATQIGTPETIDQFYKFRVVNPTRFSP